jgi:CDP-glucose 4,6-dehydratase
MLNITNSRKSPFWLDRPTFITGATGLAGSWLVKHLLTEGAYMVCLVRDWIPHSELIRSHAIEQVKIVRGDICDQDLLERVLNEYEIDTVIHLAAQAIVSVAEQNAVQTFRTNIQGTWSLLEACRHTSSVKQIVMASSDKSYGDQGRIPYQEDMPLQGKYPYEVIYWIYETCERYVVQRNGKHILKV